MAFFMVRLLHPYMITGNTIALTRQTFVSKVMSLLFNSLPRFVIAFLLRSKHLLVSWLQSPSAVVLEPPKIKSDTVSTVSPFVSHEVMGPDVSAIRVVSSAYLRLLIFLPVIWIPAVLLPAQCTSKFS